MTPDMYVTVCFREKEKPNKSFLGESSVQRLLLFCIRLQLPVPGAQPWGTLTSEAATFCSQPCSHLLCRPWAPVCPLGTRTSTINPAKGCHHCPLPRL